MRWIMLLVLPTVLVLTVACEEEDGEPTPMATAEIAATATLSPAPTDTPPPPEPTDTPVPATPTPEPVVLSGVGQTATDPVEIPFTIPVATFTHDGTGNFIVYAFQGGQEMGLVANEIGNVRVRGLIQPVSDEPVVFDVSADGAWTIRIDEIAFVSGAEFSGINNDVSGVFPAPESGPWEFSNDGDSNFIVYIHCDNGSDLAVNEIGPISGSTVLTFNGDICFWEVEAEGSWSLRPR